jgi:spoIIIJ-associated protein
MSSKAIEIEEKTIDGAIEKACRDFGVPREKLNIEIISEGSNGFLGLMSKKAKIRASLLSLDMDFTLSSASPIAPKDSVREAKSDIKPETKPEAKDYPRQNPKRDRRPEGRRETRPESRPKTEQRSGRPAPASPGTSDAQPARESSVRIEAPAAPQESPIRLAPAEEALPATSASALRVRDLLAGMLSRMTFACQVTAMETSDTVILSIAGDDSGLLIGRRGQNLDALQYLLNKAVNKTDTERKMIVVDSEEYRKRREESLLGMAQRIRDKVKKTQKPLSLSHMNAHDRRIIHLALQEDDALITKSRGEGEYRKVIVLPAKKGVSGQTGRTGKSRQ